MAIKHAKQSGLPADDGSSSHVRPVDWYADHTGNNFGWYNVKDAPYSAVGNGVNDDTAEIQAAMTAAATAGGGTVYFPPGTYLVSGATALLFTGDNVVLRGAARGATTIKYNGSGCVFTNSAPTTTTRKRCGIESLTIDTSAAADGHIAILMQNMHTGSYRDLFLRGVATLYTDVPHGTGIKFLGDASYHEASWNSFYDVDIWANLACVNFTNIANANVFYGGHWEGMGYMVYGEGAVSIPDTNQFIAITSMCSGATTSYVVRLYSNCNGWQFIGCRWEPWDPVLTEYPIFYVAGTCNGTQVIGGSGPSMQFSGPMFLTGIGLPGYDSSSGSGGTRIIHGPGSPESDRVAGPGSIYMRNDGGAGTSLYVKESGTGNTGWKRLVGTAL